MPRVSFAQPAMAADSDEARSFRTHASYVRAFSNSLSAMRVTFGALEVATQPRRAAA